MAFSKSWSAGVVIFLAAAVNLAQAEPLLESAKYVPNEFSALAVTHPQQIMADPVAEMMPWEIYDAVCKKVLGVELSHITEVVVVQRVEVAKQDTQAVVVIRLSQPYPAESVMPETRPFCDLVRDGDRTFWQGRDDVTPNFGMPDDRTLLVGAGMLLKEMWQANGNSEQVNRLLTQQREGDIYSVADGSLIGEALTPIEPLLGQLPPPLANLARAAKSITLVETWLSIRQMLDAPVKLKLKLHTEKAEDAQQLAQASEAAMDFGFQLLQSQLSQSFDPEDPLQAASGQYTQRILQQIAGQLKPTIVEDTDVQIEGSAMGQVATNGVMVAMLLPAIQAARQAARRATSANNMKQLLLAMHLYAQDHGNRFPAPANYDADGKPLLSWRVHLLPYLDQEALYKQFHLDEPWDSAHNRTLIQQRPGVFMNPMAPEPGKSVYMLVTGKNAPFTGKQGPALDDGVSRRVVLVEASEENALVWTQPGDWKFDPTKPIGGLGTYWNDSVQVGNGDGSIHRIPLDGDPDAVRTRIFGDQ